MVEANSQESWDKRKKDESVKFCQHLKCCAEKLSAQTGAIILLGSEAVHSTKTYQDIPRPLLIKLHIRML